MPKKDDDDDEWVHWDGLRGVSWLEYDRNLRVPMSALYGSSTGNYSGWQACVGLDAGGDAPGAPLLPAGAGALGAQTNRNKLQAKTYAKLVSTQDDQRVKNLLLALPPGDIPNPTGGPGFQGVGRRAYILLQVEGLAPIDDEFINRKLVIFNTASILSAVGYGLGSITLFNRYLNETVYLLPAANQPTDNQRTVKILECISKEAPAALALEATKEIKSNGANRRFVLPAPAGAPVGQLRDLQAI